MAVGLSHLPCFLESDLTTIPLGSISQWSNLANVVEQHVRSNVVVGHNGAVVDGEEEGPSDAVADPNEEGVHDAMVEIGVGSLMVFLILDRSTL
jgi:exosome complex RNA-binding protein Rrp4